MPFPVASEPVYSRPQKSRQSYLLLIIIFEQKQDQADKPYSTSHRIATLFKCLLNPAPPQTQQARTLKSQQKSSNVATAISNRTQTRPAESAATPLAAPAAISNFWAILSTSLRGRTDAEFVFRWNARVLMDLIDDFAAVSFLGGMGVFAGESDRSISAPYQTRASAISKAVIVLSLSAAIIVDK
jgi:hypothetical protein